MIADIQNALVQTDFDLKLIEEIFFGDPREID
jgi:hypothetical protein